MPYQRCPRCRFTVHMVSPPGDRTCPRCSAPLVEGDGSARAEMLKRPIGSVSREMAREAKRR